jgi:hypothetical protein
MSGVADSIGRNRRHSRAFLAVPLLTAACTGGQPATSATALRPTANANPGAVADPAAVSGVLVLFAVVLFALGQLGNVLGWLFSDEIVPACARCWTPCPFTVIRPRAGWQRARESG